MSTRKDSVVVDFFAGSGTTAHAVMSQNALDGGQRRWISVQLPETTPEGSPARTAGFPTISCLASERIRRAAHSIQEGETESGSLDTGFRYLSVTSTNFTDVDEKPDELVQDSLLTSASNTKLDRSSEDLLFECLTIWGLDLSLPIFSERVKNHEIVDVDHGALIACFDEEVDPDLVREVAAREPTRAVFNDSSFKTDADRINAEQIFKEISPATEVKVI